MMRIRLQFEFELDDQLSSYLFHIDVSTITTVSDLVYNIYTQFSLAEFCPHGIILQVDGYSLLAAHSITVIRDDEVVR